MVQIRGRLTQPGPVLASKDLTLSWPPHLKNENFNNSVLSQRRCEKVGSWGLGWCCCTLTFSNYTAQLGCPPEPPQRPDFYRGDRPRGPKYHPSHPARCGTLSVAYVGGDELLKQCEGPEAQLKACVSFQLRRTGVQVGGWLGWLALVLFLSSPGK